MITYLGWDSKFFKKKIARIDVDANYSLKRLQNTLRLFFSQKYDCGYLMIPSRKKELINYCINRHFFLADRKLVMRKKTSKSEVELLSIDIQTELSKDRLGSLKTLSHQIAKMSRFYRDPKFKPQAFRLYEEWIKNTFRKRYQYQSFFAFINKKVVGFITVKIKDNAPYIDLFGVGEDYRRRGIGRQLLQKVDQWAGDKGYEYLFVTTQKENKIAFLVYEKYGFRPHSLTNVYHIWRNHDKNTI